MADGAAATLLPTEEQTALRESVSRRLATLWPAGHAGTATPAAADVLSAWRSLCDELGVGGLGLPEERGGSGGGMADLAVALEELGRALAPVPALSCGVARALLAAAQDRVADGWLADIAGGDLVATVATPAATDLRLDRGRVSGALPPVMDGALAGLLLAVVDADQGPTLIALDCSAPGVVREPLSTLDLSRGFARFRLDDVDVVTVGEPGAAAAPYAAALDVARVLLSAEQLGGMAACLEASVSHCSQRVQFGRPIGSFQVVKHRCANMLIDIESARAAVSYAAWVADHRPAELRKAAAMAQSVTAEGFVRVAGHNLQNHGGLGFTWEHSAHRYLKRARSTQALFGGPRQARRRLAESLDLVPSGGAAS